MLTGQEARLGLQEMHEIMETFIPLKRDRKISAGSELEIRIKPDTGQSFQ
jgi:hypothetical protein